MRKLAFCTLFSPDDRSAWGGKHYLMLKAFEQHFDVSIISAFNEKSIVKKTLNKYFQALNGNKEASIKVKYYLEILGDFFQDKISKEKNDFLFFPNNFCVAYVDTVKPTILSVDSLTNSYLLDKNLLYIKYPVLFLELLKVIIKKNINVQFPTYYESLPFWGTIERKQLFETGLENDVVLNQLIEKQILKKFPEDKLVLPPGLESKRKDIQLLLGNRFDTVWTSLRKIHIYQSLQESNNSNFYGVAYGPINANKLSKRDTFRVRQGYNPNTCRLLFIGTDWEIDGGRKAYQIMLDLNRMGLLCELAVCGCVPPSNIRHPLMRIIKGKNKEQDRRALDEEYLKASFFLAFTSCEDFPNAVAQAASWGVPVIGLDIGNLKFIIKDGLNGYLFGVESPSSNYAERIYQAYKNKLIYFDLCQGAYERHSCSLSWDKWGDQTSRVFCSMIYNGNNSTDKGNKIYGDKENGQHFPFHKFIEIDVTYRCNLGCFNCNRSCGVAPSTEDITVEQIKRFIVESKNSHRVWSQIKLIGGEATLHPRILDIVGLLVDYKKEFPQTEILLATNGCGNFVQEILRKIPLDIHIINTKKSSKIQEFVPMNVAPVDVGMNVGFNPGCSIMRCGIGLNSYGFYHCSVAGGIDRVLGDNIGRKELPLKTDSMLKERLLLCRMCGFQIQNVQKTKKQITSPSWKKALNEYRTIDNKLTPY